MTTLVVNAFSTREQLTQALDALNTKAKALSRRGPSGTRSDEYAEVHAAIGDVLALMGLA